jgi:RNA polymerase sigma-70 factor, ECF subfamily
MGRSGAWRAMTEEPDGLDARGAGDRALLRSLYLEHAAPIRSVLCRLAGPGVDADDLLHEVFLVALKRKHLLSSALGTPKAWLYGIAVKVSNASRRRARMRNFLGLEAASEVAGDESPARDLERSEAKRVVYSALDRLSERKRTVFILFEIEGLSGDEIATALDCPVKTVWTRLYHARREFLACVTRMQVAEKEVQR